MLRGLTMNTERNGSFCYSASVPSQTAVSPVRGRPRQERADTAIAEALRALLVEVGYSRLTMEAVATRAGVGKATLYRRYASKVELVFANAIHSSTLRSVETGSLRGDLVLLSERIVADLGPPEVAAAVPGLLADLAHEPQLREHFQTVFIASERTLIAELLDRARTRGELTQTADVDLVHALLLGSVFAALFLLDLPPSPELAQDLGALTATALERTPDHGCS